MKGLTESGIEPNERINLKYEMGVGNLSRKFLNDRKDFR